jgi:hypothetical protein
VVQHISATSKKGSGVHTSGQQCSMKFLLTAAFASMGVQPIMSLWHNTAQQRHSTGDQTLLSGLHLRPSPHNSANSCPLSAHVQLHQRPASTSTQALCMLQ